jgi:ARG and Rhodanese-Phosphatase-superfamily-associated Protein domain
MKRCWIISFCLLIIQIATAQITNKTVYVDYDSAWSFKNLKVIPIRGQGPGGPGKSNTEIISLQQGLKTGVITLSERGTASTENVHWVRLNNKSNKPVFVGSGEILIGGRQDRMITRDTILIPAGKDQYVAVMCVEEGRWSDKEKKFLYGNYANPRLRKVLDQSKNQVRIWREISNQLDSNKINSFTMAYVAPHADKKLALQREEYFNFLQDKFRKADSTIVGFVCISGNKVIGSDIFSASNLFYNSLDAMLQGYIEEAIYFGKPPSVNDKHVKDYMDQFLVDEKTQEEYLKKNGKIFKYNDRVIHLTAY